MWVKLITLLAILTLGCQSEQSGAYHIVDEQLDSTEVVEDSTLILNHYKRNTHDSLPRRFVHVPGSKEVYRSNQPKIHELEYILTHYDIDVIVRMNSEEGTGVSIGAEKRLVESMGKTFIWVNAHQGYVRDSGYVESLNIVQPILDSGNVLIHCAAGMDRTGYMVGKWLLDNTDFTKKEIYEYTASFNYWNKHVCNRQWGYIKYMEAFMTIDEWRNQIGCK